MNDTIIALLQENNRILREINQKLSSNQPSIAPVSFSALTPDILQAIAEQYTQHSDIVSEEDAVVHVIGGNVMIKSRKGRVNANLMEKTVKSSFIKSVAQKGNLLIIQFKTGKTYQYTSSDKREFNRVADLLLTADYVSHPFLSNLKSNPRFQYQVVA